MLCGCSIVNTIPSALVNAIEPSFCLNRLFFCSNKDCGNCSTIELSADALCVEEVYKLFSMAFAQVCALRVVDELAVESLTHGLTAAEVTAVFRGRGLGRAAGPGPQQGVICNLGKFPEKIRGKLGERKDCLLIRAS
jgi:hypothetical protein